MSDYRNTNWILQKDSTGHYTFDCVKIAVLMDIRDELQRLNRLLNCSNFLSIPSILRDISKNTTKRKYTRKQKASS